MTEKWDLRERTLDELIEFCASLDDKLTKWQDMTAKDFAALADYLRKAAKTLESTCADPVIIKHVKNMCASCITMAALRDDDGGI